MPAAHIGAHAVAIFHHQTKKTVSESVKTFLLLSRIIKFRSRIINQPIMTEKRTHWRCAGWAAECGPLPWRTGCCLCLLLCGLGVTPNQVSHPRETPAPRLHACPGS